MSNVDSILKKKETLLCQKGPSSQSYGFSSRNVWMWELMLTAEELMLLNCGVGEDSWESLGLQGDPKGNQSWIFIGRTDAEAESPILWPPDVKNWLIGKDPVAGQDWRQKEKRMTEDKMVGWQHRLNGHEFGWTLKVGDGQGGLACCSPRGCKESDTTEWLNWTDWFTFQYCLRSLVA